MYSELLHFKSSYSDANPSISPIFQCSGYEVGSPVFYGRKGSPNLTEVESIIAKMDNAKYALAVNSGMTTILMCLMLLNPGDSILLGSKIYGCTYKLFEKYCSKNDIKLDILDLSDKTVDVTHRNYQMVFFETPTNPFLSTVDIKEISSQCKKNNPNCLVVVDNTWATPLYQKPLDCGADLALYSGSKYFGGHSDLICGLITLSKCSLYEQLYELRFYGGLFLQPFAAWLLRRSLQTFEIRMQRQYETTRKMVSFLRKQNWVRRIYYPKTDGKQLVKYGGIIFIEITDEALEHYNQSVQKLTLFGTGTGMACVTSMIAQPYYGSHASLTEEEKFNMGIKPNLVRLCFGLESPDDLMVDLKYAFS